MISIRPDSPARGADKDTATTKPVLPYRKFGSQAVFLPTGLRQGRELGFSSAFVFRFEWKALAIGTGEE